FGDRTSAGRLTHAAHKYSPNTVFPAPGGATKCSLFLPACNSRWAISMASRCEGRNDFKNCTGGNSGLVGTSRFILRSILRPSFNPRPQPTATHRKTGGQPQTGSS